MSGNTAGSEDEPALVASEGVGSGGKGHMVSDSRIYACVDLGVCNLDCDAEWHDASNLIGSNYRVFAARKARAMQEVALDGSMEARPAGEEQRRRKRDLLFKVAGSGLAYVKGMAELVAQNEVVKKNVDRASDIASSAKTYTAGVVTGAQTISAKVATGVVEYSKGVISKGQAVKGELSSERRDKYVGWMMEKIKTPVGAVGAVGMFLARPSQPGGLSPFEMVMQQQATQKRAEAIDIAARKDLKSTFAVQPGETLNWTFAVKGYDVQFHVRARTMRDMGGADDLELVPSVKGGKGG
ncbi:hypothetical protein T484DRAFT_1811539 [Baffinella frigidus]|nr:hypothetical protein T484DRAFT_1811539 [Cryptophyta sp. CCMP2293]